MLTRLERGESHVEHGHSFDDFRAEFPLVISQGMVLKDVGWLYQGIAAIPTSHGVSSFLHLGRDLALTGRTSYLVFHGARSPPT